MKKLNQISFQSPNPFFQFFGPVIENSIAVTLTDKNENYHSIAAGKFCSLLLCDLGISYKGFYANLAQN